MYLRGPLGAPQVCQSSARGDPAERKLAMEAPQITERTATPTVGASAADRRLTAVSGVCEPELSPSGSHRVAVGIQRVTHRAGLLVQRTLGQPRDKCSGADF